MTIEYRTIKQESLSGRGLMGLLGAAIAAVPLVLVPLVLVSQLPTRAETVAAPLAATSVANPATTQMSYVTRKETLLRLTLSRHFTATGERILILALIRDGQVIDEIQAVSGKADVQHFRVGRDSRSGSREPLPQGTYRIGAVDRGAGLPAAMGHTFIPVTPLFATSRSGIGIHHDADRAMGGAGTIGCLGLIDQSSIQTVANFVTANQVTQLIVDYGL